MVDIRLEHCHVKLPTDYEYKDISYFLCPSLLQTTAHCRLPSREEVPLVDSFHQTAFSASFAVLDCCLGSDEERLPSASASGVPSRPCWTCSKGLTNNAGASPACCCCCCCSCCSKGLINGHSGSPCCWTIWNGLTNEGNRTGPSEPSAPPPPWAPDPGSASTFLCREGEGIRAGSGSGFPPSMPLLLCDPSPSPLGCRLVLRCGDLQIWLIVHKLNVNALQVDPFLDRERERERETGGGQFCSSISRGETHMTRWGPKLSFCISPNMIFQRRFLTSMAVGLSLASVAQHSLMMSARSLGHESGMAGLSFSWMSRYMTCQISMSSL